MDKLSIKKPITRSRFRRLLGKEYFIIKRKIDWFFNRRAFAAIDSAVYFKNCLIEHQSFLLRPLKNVDMQLQHNKITNLKLAIKKTDKVVIKPGQVFSVWKLIGRPLKSKGYLDGLVLDNGKISSGVGGGLCQLGNLIYWMSLHTALTVKQRYRHGYDVFPDINRTIPFGCGATLAYNYIDLQLENTTANTFQINLWVSGEYLHGSITSDGEDHLRYEIVETDHIFKHQWWGGYTRHNKIWKRIFDPIDNSFTDELIAENNAIMMYSPLIE